MMCRLEEKSICLHFGLCWYHSDHAETYRNGGLRVLVVSAAPSNAFPPSAASWYGWSVNFRPCFVCCPGFDASKMRLSGFLDGTPNENIVGSSETHNAI